MQVYIPPKQPFCLKPPASFAIVSTMTVKTAGGECTVPASALQTIAASIRQEAVIDDIRASVQITQVPQRHPEEQPQYSIQVFFPRALVSYGTAGDVIPIFLPQVGAKCADLAESLTRTFGRRGGHHHHHHHHAYSATVRAMVAAINLALVDGIVHIHFEKFCYTSGDGAVGV